MTSRWVQVAGTVDVPGPVEATDAVVAKALVRGAANLPKHEDRPEQRAMAQAVGAAIKKKRHLVVKAGTGTGKSLAYLVPTLALGARVVVSTATKALQDQLAFRDLPQLGRSLGVRFEFAVLKGRSNYICRQRVRELSGEDDQMMLGEWDTSTGAGTSTKVGREVRKLVSWSTGEGRTRHAQISGDRAELPWEPSDAAWAQVSTGWRECPGAAVCPSGSECFSESARHRAAEADVVIVNTHLYAASLALKEAELLPPHDVVVFDEAHELEDIASAAFGFELNQARLLALARTARSLVSDGSLVSAVEDAAVVVGNVLRAHRGQTLPRPLESGVVDPLVMARERLNSLFEDVRKTGRSSTGGGEATGDRHEVVPGSRRSRAQKAASRLLEEINEVLDLPEGQIAWVEGPKVRPSSGWHPSTSAPPCRKGCGF